MGIGDTFKWMGKKAHYRGEVDDQVCFRVWSKKHQCWVYHCEPKYLVSECKP